MEAMLNGIALMIEMNAGKALERQWDLDPKPPQPRGQVTMDGLPRGWFAAGLRDIVRFGRAPRIRVSREDAVKGA